MKPLKLRIAAGIAAVAAVVGGGAALAATQHTPKQESDAIVADAARQLGVSADELNAALRTALKNRVDAALAAGTITQAQATAMKQRVDAGGMPLVGLGPGGGRHGGPGHHVLRLDAAATFLGITEADLRARLRSGDTLADVAKAEGRTTAGLVQALVASATELLDEKVAEGELTTAQRTQILAGLEARIRAAVNADLPVGHGPRGPVDDA